MRDDVRFALTPKAFIKTTYITGVYLPSARLVVIDTGSRSMAERWVSLMRETLGSFAAKPVEFA